MPLFIKPQFNSVWANTGTKLTPDNSKISQGWIVEIPPYEFDNWVQNRQDALLAHLNQLGVPMWDSTVEYQANKSYVQGITSGTVFRALTTNTNINPELDIQGNWTVAFQAQGEALLKSQNLADIPDKALARTNLGIATTEFYDGRYLQKVSNFGDVPNKASARNNLEIYSKQEVLDLLNSLLPAGEIAPFAMPVAPAGWLECNGAAVSRTTYQRLFLSIGTRFGVGNGTTTFNLPDMRGEFPRGFDNGRGVDVGRVFGSSQADAVRVWANIRTDDTSRFAGGTGAGGSYLNSGTSGPVLIPPGVETRPRNIALLYCIRT